MSTIQFEPRIAAELQIDWRRPSAQDPFAELFKQHVESDQRPPTPRLRDEAADLISGRPPRVVLSHERTIRGEAQRVDDCEDRLCDQASAGARATVEPGVPCEDGAAAAGLDGPAEIARDGETEVAVEQPAPEGEVVAPAALVPPVAATSEFDVAGATELSGGPVPSPEQTGTPTEGADADAGAAAKQQAVAAMAESSLLGGLAGLMSGQAAPTEGTDVAAALPQAPTIAGAPTKARHPLLQMVPAATVEPAAIMAARPEGSPIDIKLRSSAHAAPAAPTALATPTPSGQPTAPQAAGLLQPAGSAFGDTGETFGPAWLEEGNGQGWALHLAQGAAGRRPDFVAQLRQHLQNLPAHEQVAIHLQRAVREGTNKFSIQLSPAELGNIHVKLEIDEDRRVTAAVTVERPSTLELLQRDTKGLERALHNAGLNMEGGDLSFSLGYGSDQEIAQDLRRSVTSAGGGTALDAKPDGDQADRPAAQLMDTAAGVVNLQV
jgi:hypothetical protein